MESWVLTLAKGCGNIPVLLYPMPLRRPATEADMIHIWTHRRTFTPAEWAALCRAALGIVANSAGPSGQGRPIITDTRIVFGERGGTFNLTRAVSGSAECEAGPGFGSAVRVEREAVDLLAARLTDYAWGNAEYNEVRAAAPLRDDTRATLDALLSEAE